MTPDKAQQGPHAEGSEAGEHSAPQAQRLAILEEGLTRLTRSVAGMEARLAALEKAPPDAVILAEENLDDAALAQMIPSSRAVSGVLTEIGRCVLVAAGGFLVRAITDSGTIARPAGVALGLAYAVAWIVLADRAAAGGRNRSASFLSITAVALAYPLLWETTARMNVLSPGGAAAGIAVLTALVLAVAARRDLAVLGWAALLAAASVSIVLGLTTGRIEPFAAALLAIAAATASLGRAWRGAAALQWPAAAAADLLILWATLRLIVSPTPEASPLSTLALASAAALFFLGRSIQRVLRDGPIPVFDALQTALSLALGIAGALAAARAVGSSPRPVGAALIALSAICFGVSVRVAPRDPRRSFFFYSTCGLFLALIGTSLALDDGPASAILWSLLAAVAVFLSRRERWRVLRGHSAVYAVAAAWQSGLLVASFQAFLSADAAGWGGMAPAAYAALLAAGLSDLMIVRQDARGGASERIPELVLAAIWALGLAALAVAGLQNLLPKDAGTLAAVRTAVLSGAALLLAWARRRTARAEFSWLAAAALLAGAAKLVLEDLPHGRSFTLFAAFVLYGAGLLATQRLLKSSPARG